MGWRTEVIWALFVMVSGQARMFLMIRATIPRRSVEAGCGHPGLII